MKTWQVLLTVGSLATTGVTWLSDAYMKKEVFNPNTPIIHEPPQTSIIVPTLNEEGYILEALASLETQNIRLQYPGRFEVIVVDGGSTDKTIELAERFTKNILKTPIGKLTARDKGILNAKGKVIVGVDADTFYPPNWLNLVLRHFRDPAVVGVSTPRLFGRDANMLVNTVGIWRALWDGLQGQRMAGSNGTFLKTAYYESGGFNLAINQRSSAEMVAEEEYAFPNRLRRLGKVVWEWKAPCFTSARRYRGTGTETRSFGKDLNDRIVLDDFPLLYPEV